MAGWSLDGIKMSEPGKEVLAAQSIGRVLAEPHTQILRPPFYWEYVLGLLLPSSPNVHPLLILFLPLNL